MAKRLRTAAVLVLAVLFLLACHVAAPVLYAAEDTSLLGGYLPRRRLDGRLSADALDIFLVRRLHERAGDPAYHGYQRIEGGAEEAQALMAQQVEIYHALLGDAAAETLLEALAAPGAGYTCATDSYDFAQYLCDFGNGQGMMGLEYDPLSGAVVRLWVQSRMYTAGSGAAQKLEEYKALLGLDGLAGWQAGAGYYDATLTAENAGLMLYLYDKSGVFQLGVEVLGGGQTRLAG